MMVSCIVIRTKKFYVVHTIFLLVPISYLSCLALVNFVIFLHLYLVDSLDTNGFMPFRKINQLPSIFPFNGFNFNIHFLLLFCFIESTFKICWVTIYKQCKMSKCIIIFSNFSNLIILHSYGLSSNMAKCFSCYTSFFSLCKISVAGGEVFSSIRVSSTSLSQGI